MVKLSFLSFIALSGVVLALGGLIAPLIFPGHSWIMTTFEGLALLCFSFYLTMNWKYLKTVSTQRATRLGAHSILAILLLIGILVMTNFLAIRHGGRWDFSETKRFTLAPQTFEILNGLAQSISILVFTHERSLGYRAYRDLLESYALGSSFLTVKFIDPEKHPDLAKQYEITKIDTAVFERGTKTVHVIKPTEVELTGAILRVTKDTQKQIGFLKGHGERGVEDPDRGGFSLVKDSLARQGFDIESISIQPDQPLDLTTSILVVAGPRQPFTSTELKQIEGFIGEGGKLLLLLDPQTNHGLSPLLQQWGVHLEPGIIVDPEHRIAQGNPTALLVRTFTDHEITHSFTVPILFPVSQGISFHKGESPNWEFTPLAQTSPQGWIETDLTNTTPQFNSEVDMKGPITLAAALEYPESQTPSPKKPPAIVIIGNSTFATNRYFNFPGNMDFFLQSTAWLANEQDLLSITPKDPALRPFIPDPNQQHVLLAVQVFSLPFLVLILGLTVWRRRRRL